MNNFRDHIHIRNIDFPCFLFCILITSLSLSAVSALISGSKQTPAFVVLYIEAGFVTLLVTV